MNSCFYKFPLLLTAFFFPLLLMALEKIELPIGLRYRISAASMATLQNCRQITLFSEKHKYYFVFSTAYDLGQDKSKEFDHIFIFRNDLNERSLVFYWEPYFNFVQIQQLLDNNFHQDIPADKFRWFSGIAISEKAAVAGYFLKEKFFISTVHLHSNVNLRPVNGETQVINLFY